MSRRAALFVVGLAGAMPRLVVMAVERDQLLGGLTEKSDRFARTFVASGTFGFLPGVPSGYTQPLYAFFLAPIYWGFGHSWVAVALIQVVVAVGTALAVYAIGTVVASRGIGVGAALLATLNPYLIWHDVHLNREVLDGLLATLLTLLVVVATQRASIRIAAAAGVAVGLAILGNARLTVLPLVLAGYLLWTIAPRRLGVWAAVVLIVASAAAVMPWVVRNDISVGCATVTTDARALWKANNPATYDVLRRGGWIDEVPELVDAPPWPELAADLTLGGKPTTVDECSQMRYYRGKVLHFWKTEPGEKAKLSLQAVWMLWRPSPGTEGTDPAGGISGLARTVFEPSYILAIYAFALVGLRRLRRNYVVLTLLLLGYSTVMAMVFAGTMRYSAPWNFLLCVPAAVGVAHVVTALRDRRRGRMATT